MFNDPKWDPSILDNYLSIGRMVEINADESPNIQIMAYRGRNGWKDVTYRELIGQMRAVACGLIELGLKPGERVAILAQTRIEWAITDLGILAAGGVTVPIYHSNLASECEYILANSECRVVFVENNDQLQKILEIEKKLPDLKKIVVMTEVAEEFGEKVIDLQKLLRLGEARQAKKPGEYRKRLEKIVPADLASIVYTSGTTGPPKGVMLSHGNFLYVCWALEKVIDAGPGDVHLSHLPLAHIYERVGGHIGMLYRKVKICYATSIDNLSVELKEVRPTILMTVPRLFEKLYAGVMARIESSSAPSRKLAAWAFEIGGKCYDYEQQGKRPPISMIAKKKLAHKLFFSSIIDRFGGRLRLAASSSAPISPDILRFLSILGLDVLEAWGLTETTGPVTCNRLGYQKIGAVGPPLPGAKVKIAEDGEVLVQGGQVTSGYWKMGKETAETIINGWFYTGDIGELDEDGFLRITDRKKDIIITAGGKNIAPQNIENIFKSDQFISEIAVVGDRKKFLVALITLDNEHLLDWANQHNVPYSSFSELTETEEVYNLVEEIVRDKNEELASFETIKRFKILPNQFSIEDEEITPTMKLRRGEIAKRYAAAIEELYADLPESGI